MRHVLAALGMIALLVVAAFCVYGFLTTFEPADAPTRHWTFRIGYVTVGLMSVAGAVVLTMRTHRSKRPGG